MRRVKEFYQDNEAWFLVVGLVVVGAIAAFGTTLTFVGKL